MAHVLFKSGTYANYLALATKDANTLYFCTDTKQIFKGSDEYEPAYGGIVIIAGSEYANVGAPFEIPATEGTYTLNRVYATAPGEATPNVVVGYAICESYNSGSGRYTFRMISSLQDNQGVTSITAGTGLSGGTITSSGTISHATPSGTAGGSVGDTTAQTPSWGGTFKAINVGVDGLGHVTTKGEHTVTIPNSTFTASTSSAAGTVGLVPAPSAGNGEGYFLDATGAWVDIGTKLSSVFDFKGTVATVADLPTTGNKKGDVYHVTADSSEYVWTSSSATGTASDWEELGFTVSLDGYLNKGSNTLVSGNFVAMDNTSSGSVKDAGWGLAAPSSSNTIVVADTTATGKTKWSTLTSLFAGNSADGNMVGADGTTAGKHGLVPAPAATDNAKFLRGDGTWVSLPAAVDTVTLSGDLNGTGTLSGTTITVVADVLTETATLNSYSAASADATISSSSTINAAIGVLDYACTWGTF